MAKKIDVSTALGQSKKDYQCIEMKEEYHQWNKRRPWDTSAFEVKKLTVNAIEVKAAVTTGERDERTLSKKDTLDLKCGVRITSGRIATTQQNKTARFNIRIDSIVEFNAAMKELSESYGFDNWWVNKMEVYNKITGAKLYYEIFSPNGVDRSLYFKSAETTEYTKEYHLLSLYEQQNLCNCFYEKFAACSMEYPTVPTPTCAIEKRKSIPKTMRTPQSGYKRKRSASNIMRAS